MPCQNLDATILLEAPPDFEIVDGLVYITDRIGSLTIRRVMRPHAFELSMRKCQQMLADWHVRRVVVPFPEH